MRADVELNPAEQGVERALLRHYATGDPAPAFVERLERQLNAQAVAVTGSQTRHELAPRFWQRWRATPRSLRWATGMAALLVVLALVVGALGPQRVWAQVQRLLGYVPGIGFVNLADARVLVAPVQIERDGVTLRVEQVIADAGRTSVVLSSRGLPAQDSSARSAADFAARLRLPDGSSLNAGDYALRWGAATIAFPPLPSNVYTATLELDRLPLLPPGAAPENWAVALALRPATGPLVSQLFAEPYQPAGASDTQAGITLSVVQVAHSPQTTALTLRGVWTDPTWQIWSVSGGMTLPVLRDDVGHLYREAAPAAGDSTVAVEVIHVEAGATPAPPPTVLEQELAFSAVSALATHLTLTIDSLRVSMPVDATFEVALPPGVRAGDRWPLDIRLDVAGFPVHVTDARLVEQATGRLALELELTGITGQDGRTLTAISPGPADSGFWLGASGSYDDAGQKLRFSLDLNPDMPLTATAIPVQIESVDVTVPGPWRLSWAVPGRGAAPAVPITLRPAAATDTHHGLTLRVRKAIHTDRLIRVVADLRDPPADVQLYQLIRRDPGSAQQMLTVTDEQGTRYAGDVADVAWRPAGETDAPDVGPEPGVQALTLPPVSPLARRVTVTFPGIAVLRPGRASFNLTVPSDIQLQAQAGRPPLSAPWPVDISFKIGGYTSHFAEAQLVAVNEGVYLMLVPQPAAGSGRPGLFGFCGLRITGPSGAGAPTLDALGQGPCTLAPGFAVMDPATGEIVPGMYQVEVNGYTEYVHGPWRLSWDLTGQP